MEIIQFLIKYFLSTDTFKPYAPILEVFKENNFDLNKVIKHLDLKTILPLLAGLLGNFQGNNKNSESSKNSTEGIIYKNNLSDIANIADKQIIYSLNRYFA